MLFVVVCAQQARAKGAQAESLDALVLGPEAGRAFHEKAYGDRVAGQDLWKFPEWSTPLLAAGRFQEVVWRLEDEGQYSQAQLVKRHLYGLMTRGAYDKAVVALGMGGATKPQKVLLREGVVGVYKAVSNHPSADHNAEVATYALDQLIGFRLVPMTVLREINGKLGSLQYFIKEATPAKKIAGFERSPNLNTLDYLISNKDRNGDNLLMVLGRQVAIDHGLALRGGTVVGRYLVQYDKLLSGLGVIRDPIRQNRLHPASDTEHFQADRRILKRLEAITLADLEQVLSPYLSPERIARIDRHRVKLLGHLHAAGYF